MILHKNRVKIKIQGEEFYIKGSMPSAHMKKIADFVDEKMQQISEANPKLSHQKVAVLTCLNLAEDLLKLEEIRKPKRKGNNS